MPAPTTTNSKAPARRDEAPARGGRPSDGKTGGKGPNKGRRDGGKGRGGRPQEARDNAPTGRVVESSVVVDRAAGVQVVKKTRTSFPGAKVVDLAYEVVFAGHAPIRCERLGQARDRLKEGPPVAAAQAEETAEVAAETTSAPAAEAA